MSNKQSTYLAVLATVTGLLIVLPTSKPLAVATQTTVNATPRNLELYQATSNSKQSPTTKPTPDSQPVTQTSWKNPRLVHTLSGLSEEEKNEKEDLPFGADYPLTISLDSNTLASGGFSAVHLWNLETGQEIGTISNSKPGVSGWGIKSLSFSPDGKLLSVASQGTKTVGTTSTNYNREGIVEVWNVRTGDRLGSLPLAARLNAGQTAIISLGEPVGLIYYGKEGLNVLDINQKKLLFSFKVSKSNSTTQLFYPIPNSQTLAVLWFNGIQFWNLKNGESLGVFDGKSLTSDVKITPENIRFRTRDGGVVSSPGGDLLAISNEDKSVTLVNIQDLQNKLKKKLSTEVRKFDSQHQKKISFMAFSFNLNNPVLATASEDKTVKLWDVKTGTLLKTITEHKAEVTSIAFSPDDKTLVTSDRDGQIHVWRNE
jgi:WD40 repeat protein